MKKLAFLVFLISFFLNACNNTLNNYMKNTQKTNSLGVIKTFRKAIPWILAISGIKSVATKTIDNSFEKPSTNKNITNIAFEGGGVLGIAYGGSLKIFEEHGILHNVENVAGTSAGSIVALMVALRYNATEMEEILFSLNYTKFEDDGNYLRIFSEYGYYKTDYARSFIEGLIYSKWGRTNITFTDLKLYNNPNLYVFATDLSTNSGQEFSYNETPQMPVSEAVVASMSIPLFFASLNINGSIYVDGGVTFNYPLEFFDSMDPYFENTIGLAFAQSTDTPENKTIPDKFGYNHFEKFIKHYIVTIQNSQAAGWYLDSKIRNSTILIQTDGIKSTDFNLTNEQKNLLYQNGITAANNYFMNKT